MVKALFMVIALILFDTAGPNAHAGIFEISASANYRSTNFDSEHSDAMESGTAAFGYYFWDLCAVEASYTRGAGEQITPEYTAYQDFTSYGTDLLITVANRESAFKPYLKLGAAYVVKNLREQVNDLSITVVTQGVAPTAGIGFKLMLTQQFGLHAGIDVSTSPVFLYSKQDIGGTPLAPDQTTYDFAASAGINYLF